MLNKKILIEHILKSLHHDLAKATIAAKDAHAAATDDENVAETKYDTLAIEAGYLAEGQSRRIMEIQTSIVAFEELNIQGKAFNENNVTVSVGCLVQLSEGKALGYWFFLAPFSGGLRINIEGQQVTLITPQSPMGKALLGKELDEDIDMSFSSTLKSDYIVNIH